MYYLQLQQSFPKDIRQELENVLSILAFNPKKNDLISSNFYEVWFNGELLKIPFRLYFEEPNDNKVKKLSSIEKDILHCLFLKHHNGHIREKHLKQLLYSKHTFVIPFSFQLLGEYVIQILDVLDQHVDNNLTNYQDFVNHNPTYWLITQSRVASYWNEYYRPKFSNEIYRNKFPNFKDYIGYHIIKKIKT